MKKDLKDLKNKTTANKVHNVHAPKRRTSYAQTLDASNKKKDVQHFAIKDFLIYCIFYSIFYQ
jgi:hypothetical protein